MASKLKKEKATFDDGCCAYCGYPFDEGDDILVMVDTKTGERTDWDIYCSVHCHSNHTAVSTDLRESIFKGID
jgi:hypothetical protein